MCRNTYPKATMTEEKYKKTYLAGRRRQATLLVSKLPSILTLYCLHHSNVATWTPKRINTDWRGLAETLSAGTSVGTASLHSVDG